MNRRWSRPALGSVALLALLAYIPALTAASGRMPADSKLYLYLDPARFLGDAASSFDPRQFAGWVPHQHIAYLWPTGPWYWLFEQLALPDWVAHRLWIGSLMLAAGLGVRWCARLLGLGQLAALVAALVYQLSPYVLPYVSRTSVMLLPWAGLGWIVGFTIRATRRRTWGDPAAVALLVFTVGAVNATALAMIVPAPMLWLVHVTWQRALPWRQALMVAVRVTVLTVPVCVWWVMMLLIQGRYGAEVLPYSESLGDVSLTSTGPEVWRSLGYWLFYVRDSYAPATTESLRYLSSSWSIVVSYAVPIVCLAGLVWVRWAHRRFAAMLVGVGAVLAVGVHPIDDRSPLMRLLAGDDESGLALALRSSTRALPVMNLGIALLAGSLVAACAGVRLRWPAWRVEVVGAGVVAALVVLNLPSLWTGAFVDPALERDEDPPAAWAEATAELDRRGSDGRVIQLPGAEFGAFRWGYTVDQPLPGLTVKPLVTRDLLPLGSAAAMDLLYALDDRIQDAVFEPGSLAPVARWLGADTVWLANDLAYDRFRTARPASVTEQVAGSPGVGEVVHVGEPVHQETTVPMVDEHSIADPAATAPLSPVDLYPIEPPGTVVRAEDRPVVVSGSGDGLVDLAAAGLLDGSELVRYSASLADEELAGALSDSTALLITDSNRDRARHWRSSQDTTGFTESDQPGLDLLRDVASDARLPVFAERDEAVDPATQTVARQVGPVTATATSYGEPFAYLPEHRPYMAIDGDSATSWTVGEHADPLGETLRLRFDTPPSTVRLVQASAPGARRITAVTVSDAEATGSAPTRVELGDESITPDGQQIDLPDGATTVDIKIAAVGGGTPGTASAVAGVGFAEIVTGLAPTVEVVRVPLDGLNAAPDDVPLTIALTRLRVDPMDRWRSDAEPALVREFELPAERSLQPSIELRVDRRASDIELAAAFGWPAAASSRLTGSLASAGVSAVDGDPATSWVTAFGEALGATLAVGTVGSPIDGVTVTQPSGDFSRITEIALRSGGEERFVTLVPDAGGRAEAVVDPPLPPGPVEVVISAIESTTTVDRRFADTVELPAAIAELALPGLAPAARVADTVVTAECVPAIAVDGRPVAVSVTITGQQAIDGDGVDSELCDPSAMSLGAGAHRAQALESGLPLQVDRVVLAESEPPPELSTATATVLDDSRFRRTIEVSGCPDGCWLVFGEGFNEGWEASGPDGSLGEPQLVDGGFNGWWIEASDNPTTVTVEWTQQGRLNLAMTVSLLGVAAAAVLLVLDRRRHVPDPGDSAELPELTGLERDLTTRSAAVLVVVWTVLSALLISPEWALAGLAAGLAVFATRISRLVPLTAWATVAAVGAMVAIRERRFAPAPNGSWPGVFESWHGWAMFAVVTVLVTTFTRSKRERLDRFEQDRHGLSRVVGEGDQVRGVASLERLAAADQA